MFKLLESSPKNSEDRILLIRLSHESDKRWLALIIQWEFRMLDDKKIGKVGWEWKLKLETDCKVFNASLWKSKVLILRATKPLKFNEWLDKLKLGCISKKRIPRCREKYLKCRNTYTFRGTCYIRKTLSKTRKGKLQSIYILMTSKSEMSSKLKQVEQVVQKESNRPTAHMLTVLSTVLSAHVNTIMKQNRERKHWRGESKVWSS